MAIFNSYVKLPEVTMFNSPQLGFEPIQAPGTLEAPPIPEAFFVSGSCIEDVWIFIDIIYMYI